MSGAGNADPGFTLLEMLVVFAVLGLIGGLVYPSMARLAMITRARDTVDSSVLTLETARARSIRTAVPVRVDAGSVPAGATITPSTGIVFYPDGSATGGAVEIGMVRYGVAPATGELVRAMP